MNFIHLNTDWNAEPNAPSLEIKFSGATTELTFLLNHWVYEAKAGQTATLRFTNCSRWNWDATNDEAWFDGNGRYSRQAPKWGEFYEVLGEERLGGNADWEIISPDVATARHFLFYFRDETLQFIASDWSLRK